MPTRFALAAAVAATMLLAVTGCSAADPDAASPQAVTEQGAQPSTTSEEAAQGEQPEQGEQSVPPSGDPGAASGWDRPEAFDSADASMRRDSGVPGLPAGSGASIDDVLRLGAVASWIEPPSLIGLSLPSSADCAPVIAAPPTVETPSTIVVTLEQPTPCEAPDAARTYTVSVPDGVDTDGEIELVVEGLPHHFTLTLPAA